MSNDSQNATPNSRRRQLLMVVVPLLVIAITGYLYLHGGRFVATDNAYVKSDKVPISADVSGPAIDILVMENQQVHQGQPLLRIDPAPFRLKVRQAEAHLAQVRTDLKALQTEYHAQESQLALAETRYAYALKKEKRESNLAAQRLIADADYDDSQMDTRLAKLEINARHHELERIADALGGDVQQPVETHPSFQQAQVALETARLDLSHTEVLAPFDGVVSQVPKPGQYLHAGSAALALVASRHFWVEANLTEKELTHVQQSQPVKISIDMFPDTTWSGVVETLSPATGAEFAIIPAQNATGNWVKIPQRVPVRIRLDNQTELPQLRAGLSAEIRIDTGFQRQLLGMSL